MAGGAGRGSGGPGRGFGGPRGAAALCGPGAGPRRAGLLPGAPPHPAPPGVHPAGGLSGRRLPRAPGHRRDRVPGERRGGPGHPSVDRAGRERLRARGWPGIVLI